MLEAGRHLNDYMMRIYDIRGVHELPVLRRLLARLADNVVVPKLEVLST